MTDLYKTIKSSAEGLYKDKGSKFIAYAFPVFSEDEIKKHLNHIKKAHFSARHHCYAWRLGADKKLFRANDDGEPSSTAGKPILGQIQSYDLSNILIIVVRYFGGTLLGVSGLIKAYRSAAKDVIRNATIIDKTIEDQLAVEYGYESMNDVMKILKEEQLPQLETQFDLRCRIRTSVRQTDSKRIQSLFQSIEGVTITIL